MKTSIVFVFIAFIVFAKADVLRKCLTDAECAQNTECCYRHEGPLIMSRRQLSQSLIKPMVYGGYCEKFKGSGAPCSPFEKMNGHCSCGPGMTCKFVPDKSGPGPAIDILPVATTQSSAKRDLYFPGPGSYQCVPKDN